MINYDKDSFRDELTKEAIAMPLKRLMSKWKGFRAARAGEKNIINKIDAEIEDLRMKDPDFNVKEYKRTRYMQLKNEGKASAATGANENISGNSKSKNQTFLQKHKGKLLLGGVGATGLYAINRGAQKNEEQKQEILQNRINAGGF